MEMEMRLVEPKPQRGSFHGKDKAEECTHRLKNLHDAGLLYCPWPIFLQRESHLLERNGAISVDVDRIELVSKVGNVRAVERTRQSLQENNQGHDVNYAMVAIVIEKQR